ncbi:MAG: hypothetical protein M1281_11235 [Chloroflexi bacterium]|nr:hypothetical protein [Chloroflexota bacterium]
MDEYTSLTPQPGKLEVHVTEDVANDLYQFISRQGWEYEEGLRLLLGAGMGYLRSSKILSETDPESKEKEIHQLIARLVETESRLAATRFRMSELQQANESWELSTGAVNTERVGLSNVVKRQREEIDQLHAEVDRLKQENAQLMNRVDQQDLSSPGSDPVQLEPTSRHKHLATWLEKLRG